MKHTLVGHTGFVGGNLASSFAFDNLYNSKNIQTAYGANNGLVVYSGMPSEKFLANADPAADLARARQAMDNILQMKPEKLVLISTVDVYAHPSKVDENTPAGGEGTEAYGYNRHQLECWVREEYPDALILRLPGLYGKGLKKNFIFDMFTLVPPMLRPDKFEELAQKESLVAQSYRQDDAGFYRLQQLDPEKQGQLKGFFAQNDFNSLRFTDSRSVFQFYDLSELWQDIRRCLKKGLQLVNLATEPIEAGALYTLLFGGEFENHLGKEPAYYDMRTLYGREFGGQDHYITDRTAVVSGIARFALRYMQ